MQLYSFTNDIILDPFMGSGTTAIAAIKSKRNYIGYDINEEYIKLANDRIKIVLQDSITLFETIENEVLEYEPSIISAI
ncbi:MAG: site-specific DNA-methyltransferase [Spirochaetaceae bacterium]|nr:site-specific DNA-methyltransferase [Spirochaetaceae bacterium]